MFICLYVYIGLRKKFLRILPIDGSHNSANINLIWQYVCVWKVTYHRVIKKKVVILVYSIKSYWKWVKIKKKFDIFWNFITKKGKIWLRLLKKFDVYGLWTWCSISMCGKRFQSGNFDVKDAPCSGRSITGKINKIMEKVE